MDYYIGMIGVFGFTWAPSDFYSCTGQTLTPSQYQALFSLIGNTFGGNGSTTFLLPNLQGRSMIGQGNLQDNTGTHSFQMAQTAGALQTTLTVNQLPSHNHSAAFAPGSGSAQVLASTSVATKTTPAAGDYIGVVANGRDAAPTFVPGGTPGTTVALGGVTATGTIQVGNTGSNQAVPTMSPYVVMNPCMCYNGIYPMRP